MELRVGSETARQRTGRRRVLAHAVPVEDRTRSAVCGSSVRRTALPWQPEAPTACPDCLAALALPRAR